MKGCHIAFGKYELQALEPAWIKARQIEAGRWAISRYARGGGKMWVRMIADKPVSMKPPETRMGKGKGATALYSQDLSIANRNFRCINSVEKSEYRGVLDVEEDLPKAKIRRKNLVVFVSGGGSNFRSIYESTLNGYVHGDVVALVTNKHDCGGAEYAREKGIPVIVFPKRKDSQEVFSADELVTTLRSYKVDFILLAGYLKLIPAELIRAYPKAILNIHPSLLPAFGGKAYYGMKVHKAVIASGARYSGPTIHYVDEHYDTGRILAQRVVPVLAKDTSGELAARVLHEENKLYVEVCAALCEERIVWREDGVPLIRSNENPNDYC